MGVVGGIGFRDLDFSFSLDFGLLAGYIGALERGRCWCASGLISSVANNWSR